MLRTGRGSVPCLCVFAHAPNDSLAFRSTVCIWYNVESSAVTCAHECLMRSFSHCLRRFCFGFLFICFCLECGLISTFYHRYQCIFALIVFLTFSVLPFTKKKKYMSISVCLCVLKKWISGISLSGKHVFVIVTDKTHIKALFELYLFQYLNQTYHKIKLWQNSRHVKL